MSKSQPLKIQNLKESTEILSQLINCSLTSNLTSEDKKEIGVQLIKMALLRGEEIDDYNFELWVEYFNEHDYSKIEIIEIIDCGKRMKKFGTNKLAIGDLISEWENSMDNSDLSFLYYKRRNRAEKRQLKS